MFQTLSNKILTGVITLSMLLLSSYEGNNARFENVFASYVGNRIFISAELTEAFSNDFEELFQSGQRIDIFFKVQILDFEQQIEEKIFRHAVIFDPLNHEYTVYLEEQGERLLEADYAHLIELISHFEYTYNAEKYRGGYVILSSYLKKIRLQSTQKEYDMMMLWKFKQPKIKVDCLS